MTMQLTDRPTRHDLLGAHRRIRPRLAPTSPPRRARGKLHWLAAGVIPLGVLLGGAVSEMWGPVGVLVGAGTLCLVVLMHPMLTASRRADDGRPSPPASAHATRHRAEATERLFRAGIQHLR